MTGAGLDEFGFDDDTWLERVADREEAPPRASAYEVLEEVGRGGQGVVHRARRRDTGEIVAIKRLHGGRFASEEMSSRFRRELAAVAALDHPSVVRCLGSDEIDGRSVLVLEWAEGAPIDAWANGNAADRRPVVEVVATLEQVARAVAHAHRRGILHRDLKPSNVLVADDGHPRVLDLGLAKRIDVSGESSSDVTRGFAGTPLYAAPECRDRNAPADTRADVFSLGAMFHVALSGEHPFGGRPAERDELATRLRDHRRDVDVDLEAIVRKALATDPDQRYQSVDAMLEDLRRRREGWPVSARAPRLGYQLQRLVRRHPMLATATLAGVVFLLAFGSYATKKEREVARQRDRAESSAERLQDVVEFFLVDVLRASESATAERRQAALSGLALAAERTSARFAQDPRNGATLKRVLGDAYAALGEPLDAEVAYRGGLALLDGETGAEPLVAARLEAGLAWCALARRDVAEAESFAERGAKRLDVVRPLERRVLARIDSLRAEVAMQRGLLDEAAALVARSRERLGIHDSETSLELASHRALTGRLALARGDLDLAERELRAAISEHDYALPEIHVETAIAIGRLGEVLLARGRLDEAEAALRHAHHAVSRAWGDGHALAGTFGARLARCLAEGGEFDSAADVASVALRRLERGGDWLHPDLDELERLAAGGR